MAESLTITCDRCHARVHKRQRTRIRWAAEGFCRKTTDLCADCAHEVSGRIHLEALELAGVDTCPAPAA